MPVHDLGVRAVGYHQKVIRRLALRVFYIDDLVVVADYHVLCSEIRSLHYSNVLLGRNDQALFFSLPTQDFHHALVSPSLDSSHPIRSNFPQHQLAVFPSE